MLKNILTRLLLISTFLMTLESFGQGVHFSMIEFAPQSVNPGNIGGFLGSYRGTGIYRSQYNNPDPVKGYTTFEIGIDVPVIRGFRKQDWIGAGISINSDQRGFFSLKDTYSRLGLSYHFGLDKKQASVLTLGVQMTNLSRSIKATSEGILTGFQINSNGGPDPDLQDFFKNANEKGKLSTSARDWTIGLVYTATTKTNVLKAGLSASGILSPRLAFRGQNDLPLKFIGFATIVNQLTKTMTLEPTALFQSAEISNEFMFNTKLGYKYNKEKNDKIKAGLGFRTGTFSAIFLVGGEIKGINFGLSYDLPLSGYADAPGTQNGFEIGASYIGLLKKTPKPKPIIICPRL